MDKHEAAWTAAKARFKHARSFRAYAPHRRATSVDAPRAIIGWTFKDGQSLGSGYHWVSLEGVLSPCGYLTRKAAQVNLRIIAMDAAVEENE